MRITPLDVHEQTFRMTFRGFDPVEVDGFLQRVADELERLSEERDGLRAELVAEREARSDLERALAAARTLQEGLLERARQEAQGLQHQAQARADRILAEANEELVQLRRELHSLRERRSLWLSELDAMAGTLSRWVEQKAEAGFHAPELIQEEESERSGEEPERQAGTVVEGIPEPDGTT